MDHVYVVCDTQGGLTYVGFACDFVICFIDISGIVSAHGGNFMVRWMF